MHRRSEGIMKRSKKISKQGIIISVSVVAVLVAGMVLVYFSWSRPQNAFAPAAKSPSAQINVPARVAVLDDNERKTDQTIPKPSASDGEFANQNAVHILLMGIDSNLKREQQNEGWRSDMIMLCSLHFDRDSILLTSIPRDTRTYAYHLDENGNATSAQLTKINSAYQYGYGPKFGAQNEMLAVHDFLSTASGIEVPIQYYVSIDLDNAPKLADELGGVPVTLDVDFPDLGKKGDTVVIDSGNADYFLQNRYDVGGDIVRAHHHEAFLMGMIQKIKDRGAVNSAAVLFNLYTKYVKTNLNLQQAVALAGILDQSDLGKLDYKVIGGEYTYINSLCYYIADKKDVAGRVEYFMQ